MSHPHEDNATPQSPAPRLRRPFTPRRAGGVVAATLGTAGLLSLAAAPAADAAPTDLADRYVAVGDSFTAGPFIPPQYGDPAMCLRSKNNYANVVADALGVRDFVDASCSAATTTHMTESQDLQLGQENAPQFDSLTDDTTLVTVGIGGNDFGFGDIALECIKRSGSDPKGSPCEDHYVDEDGDELEQRVGETGDKVAGVLAGIRDRSPNAKVAVVGYLQLLPEKGGCWPKVPIAEGDMSYLDEKETNLNAEIRSRTAEAGMTFVDVFERGHDVCAKSEDRWVEGVFPDKPAAPIHPNQKGMAATGARVVGALGGGDGAGSAQP